MKKFLSVLLAFALILSLGACSSGGGDGESGNGGDRQKEAPAAKLERSTVEQTVIYDENGIKITVAGLDEDNAFGPDFKLLLENNTDTDLLIVPDGVANVNGFSVDTSLYAQVAAGKKSNESMSLSSTDIQMCGIEHIAEMDFSLKIESASDWSTLFETGPVHIETSNKGLYTQSYDFDGKAVYDENGLKITIAPADESGFLTENIVKVRIENNSGKNYTVQARDMSLNGFMVDPVFSCEVIDGTRAVDCISLFESDIEDNSIEAYEKAEFRLHVINSDNWLDYFDTGSLTLNF